jgi:hypothetical protein
MFGNDTFNNSLNVSGTSSDNSTTDCQVSVILNALRPYQAASAVGTNGSNDYSVWNITLDPVYFLSSVKEGPDNEIAAKLTCLPDPINMTRSYTVNVTAIKASEPGTFNNDTFRTDNQSQPSLTSMNLGNASAGNNKSLSISLDIDKNRFSAGEDQTLQISVFDSATGKLVEMATGEFRITDPSGQTVDDSLFMMENGDISHEMQLEDDIIPGNYTATIQAYVNGYASLSKNLTFEIVEDEEDQEN